jgi:F0F1-type ATP synthase assembly protein I
MVRAISIFGFAALFLLISPAFRGNVMDGISFGYGTLDKYSPWSYVACAVIGLIFAGFAINRGSRPR